LRVQRYTLFSIPPNFLVIFFQKSYCLVVWNPSMFS